MRSVYLQAIIVKHKDKIDFDMVHDWKILSKTSNFDKKMENDKSISAAKKYAHVL